MATEELGDLSLRPADLTQLEARQPLAAEFLTEFASHMLKPGRSLCAGELGFIVLTDDGNHTAQ